MVVAGAILVVIAVDSEAQIPVGDQFLVANASVARTPSVAMDDGGGFVVAWRITIPGAATRDLCAPFPV